MVNPTADHLVHVCMHYGTHCHEKSSTTHEILNFHCLSLFHGNFILDGNMETRVNLDGNNMIES